MATEKAAKTLAQKLVDVGASIDIVPKDAVNPHHKYRYASEKAIKEAVYPRLHKAGVLFWLSTDGEPSYQGGVMMQRFTFHFKDAASDEEIAGSFFGSGRGNDDKGFYICVTGCIKYVLTTMLGIVTGDDAEADDRPPADPGMRAQAAIKPSKPAPTSGDVVCPSCGAVHDTNALRPFPSKYENAKAATRVGQPCYKCPECGKFVGMVGAPGPTMQEEWEPDDQPDEREQKDELPF